MARKTKRRAGARRPARPAPASAPQPASAGSAPAKPRVGGDQLVRAVEMSLAPAPAAAQGRRRGARPGRVVLEDADPAIPLDRVPYFVSDLVKLGGVAAAMVVLLVLGALFVVPLIVH